MLSGNNLPELALGGREDQAGPSAIQLAAAIQEIMNFKKDQAYHLRPDYLIQKLLINL